MYERNNLILEYIKKKVLELKNIGLNVPDDNITKLYNAFVNSNADISAIKTRIDTIFNDSVNAYRQNLDKMGFNYNDIIKVYEKVMAMNKTKAKLYLTGGIVPYLLLGEESNRKHSNLNLLCNKDDMRVIREVFRNKKLYEPKRDSLTYTINNIDYGFQVVIDSIKVDILVFEEKDDGIIEYSFDCHNKIGKIKKIAAKLNDYIMPYYSSDNKKYMTKALEFIIADKLLLNRDKDKKDIIKIQECNGISSDKIKKLPLPIVKEEKLTGDNLEFTSTMPRIKLDIPKRRKSAGFINIGTILLVIAIIVCIILSR